MARANNGGWDFVKVGKTYQYKEDWFIAKVKILADNSTPEEYIFTLQVEESNVEEQPGKEGVFEIGHAKNVPGYYSGMLQIYEEDEYSFSPKYSRNEN